MLAQQEEKSLVSSVDPFEDTDYYSLPGMEPKPEMEVGSVPEYTQDLNKLTVSVLLRGLAQEHVRTFQDKQPLWVAALKGTLTGDEQTRCGKALSNIVKLLQNVQPKASETEELTEVWSTWKALRTDPDRGIPALVKKISTAFEVPDYSVVVQSYELLRAAVHGDEERDAAAGLFREDEFAKWVQNDDNKKAFLLEVGKIRRMWRADRVHFYDQVRVLKELMKIK